jgi:hypothetical protein
MSLNQEHADPTAAAGRPKPRRRRRLLIVAASILAVLAGYTTWTNTQADELESSIDINATPDRVWAVLTDLPHYQDWNPFITSSAGDLRVGATLINRMHDASGDTTFTPTVLVIRPGKELRWIGRVDPGWIFDGEHRFTLEPLGSGRTRLTQHESFTGVAVPFYDGTLRTNTLPQFQAMNAALARRAELP